jgi:hypothetical protein
MTSQMFWKSWQKGRKGVLKIDGMDEILDKNPPACQL